MKHYIEIHAIIEIEGDEFPGPDTISGIESKIRTGVFCNREAQTLVELETKTYLADYEEVYNEED